MTVAANPSAVAHMEAVRSAVTAMEQVGVAPLTLVYRSKKAAVPWEPYQVRAPSAEERAAWFGNGQAVNLGALCGPVSDGLVVLVFNAMEAYSAFFVAEPIAQQTWVAQSVRGPHVWLRVTGALPPTHYFDHPDCASALEVRSTGAYVVAPPSIHPDGPQYTWRGTRPETLLEVEDFAAWLAERLERAARFGWPLQPRSKATPDGEQPLAPPVHERISAGARNTMLISLAGTMRRRGLDEEEIAAALLVVNARRCHPPLDAREVQSIARSVVRYETDETLTSSMPLSGSRTITDPETGEVVEVPTLHWTDTGNGQRLVRRHGVDLHYCHPWQKWLVWDGARWRLDESAEVVRRAKDTVRDLWREAAAAPTKEAREALAKFAAKSEGATALAAMVNLARSDPGIPVLPGELDAHPWLLNVRNGTLDLRTGDLRPHQRAHLLTKLAPVIYDPEARCPRWDAFLRRVLPDDQVRAYVQRVAGYNLTGDTREQVLFFHYGVGQNGKSTFLGVLLDLLGDYGRQAAPEILMQSRGERHPTELADLAGARCVATIESDDGKKLAEGLVKQLTGQDRLKARRMREDFWEFTATFKLHLAANHKPVIKGTDFAIWRRIRLIPWTVVIPEAEKDRQLPERLRAEAPGILNWLVQGCLAWQRDGLDTPDAVERATATYRAEMDVLQGFLEECCVLADTVTVPAKDLYRTYTTWCAEVGEEALSQKALGLRLVERGFGSGRTSSERFWSGITLADRTSQEALG